MGESQNGWTSVWWWSEAEVGSSRWP
jgi:hypothetical protein